MKTNKIMKPVMIRMPDDMKKEAKGLAFEAIGETNLSGFIRYLIEEYKNRKK
jgi:hypothetical protein